MSAATRVLVETSDAERAAAMMQALRDEGFEATSCAGPGHDASRCPILNGQDCELVDDVDVIIHDLDLHDDTDRSVLENLRSRHPALPVVVEATTRDQRVYRHELRDCTIVVPFSMQHLALAVAGVLTESE